jgi:nucleoside-diphosphate-sugar epimerase
VRRVVQESTTLVYAGRGDDWIDEQDPLDINAATEPACVGESHVQDFQTDLRQGVVLRLGRIFGDDDTTRFLLRSARRGRAIGLGAPESWIHPLHTDDVGSAVVAALDAPSGVYNVGAEPVRRAALVQGYAEAAGRESASFMGPLTRRLAGARSEPLTRSLRVSSEHFTAQTGWRPRRATFDASWFEAVSVESEARR